VIDDVAGNRRTLVDYLMPLGFLMQEAASGEEGLAAASALLPDLILVDNIMPGMDGLETTRRLRQLPGLSTVPIIMISASASSADQQSSLSVGADSFLPKPVDFDLLLAEIGRLLGLHWLPEAVAPMLPPTAASALQTPAAAPLVPPPAAEIERLFELAQAGNMGGIRSLAERIEALGEAYRPFARHLHGLAEHFQSAAILQLVKSLREGAVHQGD